MMQYLVVKLFIVSVTFVIFFPHVNAKETIEQLENRIEIAKQIQQISEATRSALTDDNPENDTLAIDKGIEGIKRIVKECNDCAMAYWELGKLYSYKQMIKEAHLAFDKAIELEPAYRELLEVLTGAFIKKQGEVNKISSATEEEQIVQGIAENIDAILREKGGQNSVAEINNAIEKYKVILIRKPTSAAAYNALGRAYSYKGMHKEAVDNCKKAISIEPKNKIYLLTLADMYEKAAREKEKNMEYAGAVEFYNKAEKIYSEITKTERENPVIKLYIENIEHRKRYIEEDKKQDQIDKYWKLAAAASKNEDYGQAIKYLEKIEKIEPNYHESIYYNIALEYKNWGKYEKAIKLYKKQISLNPQEKSPRLYSHLGLMESYYELGEFDKAKQEGDNALKLDPQNKKAKRYLEKIKKAEKQK